MQRAVDARGLQVDVEDANLLSVLELDVGPHGTVVGIIEEYRLAVLDGVAAEDDHVAATHLHIGEILLVGDGVLLVAAGLVVLLQTEHVHLLTAHLSQDVECPEPRGLTSEHRHVVGGNLQAGLGLGALVVRAELEDGADVGNAAGYGDDGYQCVNPASADKPVGKEQYVGDDQQGQGVDQQGPCRIADR